ncbi:DUF3900 domain-containing protein [Shouchella tritolerans]|uniref:DUF3900 domain-containing protein n=1 Tax=Shouchella tritolerans TaxID=2979466 RepID=UPI00078719D2|nr:DUF3900 domain-containing protein [Shouchella tritolerans]
MEFTVQYLSFYAVQVDHETDTKQYSHYQTLDTNAFEKSPLSAFLEGELKKIVKRKAQHHPNSDAAPTKIGRFVAEPGHPLSSNPNYNLFQRALTADSVAAFHKESEAFVKTYLQTSAVRGGVFLVCKAVPKKYYSDLFLFVLKCDFQENVATLADSKTLIKKVERAITTKNMKSIQYPHMIEEGMVEQAEVKIHQSSHARYFEDFLPYVEYGDSMPQILRTQVQTIMEEHAEEAFAHSVEERNAFSEKIELWASSETRELQEQFSTHEVMEASAQIAEHAPDASTRMKLGDTDIKVPIAEFGETVHLAKLGDRYVLLVEADQVQFDKHVSPIEFLKPEDVQTVFKRMKAKSLSIHQ